MAEFGISPDDLRRLARLVEENGLSELRYDQGDLRITLRTTLSRVPAAAAPSAAAVPDEYGDDDLFSVPPVSGPDHAVAAAGGANIARIEAPVMGVFYRSSAPGAPPLVEVGDMVEAGQPVGLIEAMKVFSEVLAETPGQIRDIPVKNGALVHPGETLLVVEVLP